MKIRTVLIGVVVIFVAVIVVALVVLLTTDFNRYKPNIVALIEDATGREVEIGGDLNLNISLTSSLSISDVRIANADWGSRPNMIYIENLTADVRLMPIIFGKIAINRFTATGVEIFLETDQAGVGNWVFDSGDETVGNAETDAARSESGAEADEGGGFDIAVKEINLQRISIKFRDGKTGEVTDLSLDSLTADSGEGLSLKAVAQFRGEEIQLSVDGDPIEKVTGSAPYSFDANVNVAGATITAKGTITDIISSPRFNVQFSVAGQSLNSFSAIAASDLPDLGPYSVKARVNGGTEAIEITGLVLALAGNQISGDLSVDLSGDRPLLQAKLSTERFDLDPLMALGDGAGTDASTGASTSASTNDGAVDKIFSDDPLPIDGLHAADLEIQFDAGLLIVNKIEISNLALEATLQDGVFLQKSKLEVGGGTVEATISLDSRPNATTDTGAAFEIEPEGRDVDLGTLLKQMGISDGIRAPVGMTIALKGEGQSLRKLMASLNGKTSIVGGEGYIQDEDFLLIEGGLLRTLAPWAKPRERTVLNCFVSQFSIVDGVATSEALLIDTEYMSIRGKGSVDLGSEQLDLVVSPKAKSARLTNISIPFSIKGAFTDPSIAPTPGGAAKAAITTLGVFVNPLVLLVPLIEGATADKNPCLSRLSEGDEATGEVTPAAADEKEGGVSGVIRGIGRRFGIGRDN